MRFINVCGVQESKARHPSSLDTPVVKLCPPAASPAPSYYTPSPSPSSRASLPSPRHTPGLKFLQEEGERLSSQSDTDSCHSSSPSPRTRTAAAATSKEPSRKTFRNLFKKTATAAAGAELGSLLEQKISRLGIHSTINRAL